MLSYVYYEDVFLEKQKYNHEKDESFSIQIAKILIIFFVLFLLWNGYSHYKQIDLIRNGVPVLAEVSVIGDDKYISFKTSVSLNFLVNSLPLYLRLA